MNIKIKTIIKKIIVICIIFIILFPKNISFAEFPTGLYSNDTQQNESIDKIVRGNGFTVKYFTKDGDFDSKNPDDGKFNFEYLTEEDTDRVKINSNYGWYEYKYNGEYYVIVSAASYSLFNSGKNYEWKDYIHYFHVGEKYGKQYETFEFTLANGDTTIYKAIVLDSNEEAMKVGEDDPQIISVYLGKNKDDTDKEILDLYSDNMRMDISMDGNYENYSQATSSSEKKTISDLVMYFFSLAFSAVGDVCQKLIYQACTNTRITYLSYPQSYINSNSYYSKIIQIDKDNANVSNSTLGTINVDSYEYDKNFRRKVLFNKDTQIPVIDYDIYTLTTNQIDLVDINFLNNKDNQNKVWKLISNIVSVLSHTMLYLSTALILAMIIWRAIIIVVSTFEGNAEKRTKSINIINKVMKVCIKIVGIYVIIGLINSVYDYAYTIYLKDVNISYYLRANVNGLYSFNTNIIGVLKYKSFMLKELPKLGFSFLYMIFAIINLLWLFALFFRMIFIGLLTIIAPITAVTSMVDIEPSGNKGIMNLIHFKIWIITYLKLVFIPVLIFLMIRFLATIIE